MSTWRKVGCCLFATVCGVSAAQAVGADELSVKVAVEDFVTCDPVVTATFPAGLQRVAVEWAVAEDGEFVELGAVENPEGTTFVHTNALALIADRRWYRVTATDADGSASSAAVPFARFRQLERRSTGKDKGLVDGCVQFNAYWPFEGTIDNHDNACPIGINFKRQVHIAGFRLLSKLARENNRPIYGAKSFATYSSDNVILATPAGASGGQWKFFGSSDATNTYECCYISPSNGSLEEFEIYGWEPFEAATANGVVYFDVPDLTTCAPVLTATFPAGADSVSIEEARSENGPFAPIVTVASPVGSSLVWTNSSVKVAVRRYYRVASTKGEVTVRGIVRSCTRGRRLERDPADETKRLSKYSYWATKAFNGVLTDNTDPGSPCGVDFNERVWIMGVRVMPRSGQIGRLNWKPIKCALTRADYNAGIFVQPSSPICCPTFAWYYTPVVDQDNAYQCVWVNPDAGSIEEMQIYGWDTADIEAAHEPVFPTRLTVVSGAEEGSADMAWEGAHFISSYKAYYREEGAEEWTLGSEGISGATNAYTLAGLVNGKRYEFRLEGTGEDGYVGVSPTAVALIFHYAPAGGTGLNALLMGNCDLTLASEANQFFEKRVFAGIDFNQTESLFAEEAHTNKTTALVSFRGEIEIPVDGTYTLRLDAESNDGIALAVDGTQQFNKNACGGFGSAELALTAGRHGIEIDWLNKTAQKTCRLTWTCAGVFAAETVPASQLFPAADAALPVYDRLDDVQFRVQSGQPMSRLEFDGTTYRIFRGSASNVGGRPALPSLTKVMRGKFIVEATFLSGDPCFIVASTTTVDYQAIEYANGYVRTRGSSTKGDDGSGGHDVSGGPISNGFPGAGFAYPNQMRIERIEDNVIEFKVRKEGVSKRKEWVTICRKVNGEWGANLSDKALRVGFGALGMGSELKLKDLRFRKPGGTVLFVR